MYKLRKATINDCSFLADVVIAAEKSGSNKLSFSTLMDLDEETVKNKIISMFEEEVDGCEFSISSYLIVEKDHSPVASFGSWIEGHEDDTPSKILKSNLIGYTFGTELIKKLQSKAEFISDLIIEREKNTLQFEYLFVLPEHRKNGLADMIIKEQILRFKEIKNDITKAQVQAFANNFPAIKLYERNGFKITRNVISHSDKTLLYLPFNEKVLMEKHL